MKISQFCYIAQQADFKMKIVQQGKILTGFNI